MPGGAPGRGPDEKAPRPLVMLSNPPSRPRSAPSAGSNWKRGTHGHVTILSENHRRAMDSIDALGSIHAGETPQGFKPEAPSAPAVDGRRADKGPMRSRLRSLPAPGDDPAPHDAAMPLPAGADSPRRQARASARDVRPQHANRRSADSAAISRETGRQPVSRALLVDVGTRTHETIPVNSAGNLVPAQKIPREPAREDAGRVRDIPQEEGESKTDTRKHRPARLHLPESFLSESVGRDRPHTAQSSSDAQDHARRRPKSRTETAETGRELNTYTSSQMRYIRNKKSSTGLAYRDRRPSENLAWQFRSSSPGPAGAAYARPVSSSGRGELLTSGLTYLGSAHTAFGDEHESHHQHDVKIWPNSLRKSVWSSISSERGTAVPDTGQRVRMLCDNPSLGKDLFAKYAAPVRPSNELVLAFDFFLDCLSHLESLQGSSPVLHLALEMAGVPNHQLEAKLALISEEEASLVFERAAEWYVNVPPYSAETRASSEDSTSGGSAKTAGFWGVSTTAFMKCLSSVSEMLDEKRQRLLQKMPRRKGGGKNRRLPMNDLRMLRGHQHHDYHHTSGSPHRSPVRESSESRHSPLAAISAMHKDFADPTAKQAALFKALRHTSATSEYKRLARQVARETMVQLDSAVKSNLRTLKEMEWLLLLRDQALTSLGLIVSADQIRAAAEARNEVEKPNASSEPMAPWGPPSWAWVVPSDLKKPIAPVTDGWYLVSGDPGPILRLLGPIGSRAKAIKSIQEYKELGIAVFTICLLRESSVVETFIFDSTGRRIEEKANEISKADGWYVMIHESGA
jgi:hypothetical protein